MFWGDPTRSPTAVPEKVRMQEECRVHGHHEARGWEEGLGYSLESEDQPVGD